MLISLGLNLEKQDENLTKINNSIYESIILQELFHDIEYVKNQRSDIIKNYWTKKG